MLKSHVAACLMLLVVAGAACDDDEPPPAGTLQQGWTIAGARTPEACSRFGATQMRLVVLDSSLFVEATRFAPCTDFTASLALTPDVYTGTATFLDANGVAVSNTRSITAFTISENITTLQNVDFAVGDFFRQ